MIRSATIIEQPYSGKYVERIYDIESPWNSSEWTGVKFDDDDGIWCGEFRGAPRGVVLSKKSGSVFLLLLLWKSAKRKVALQKLSVADIFMVFCYHFYRR